MEGGYLSLSGDKEALFQFEWSTAAISSRPFARAQAHLVISRGREAVDDRWGHVGYHLGLTYACEQAEG